uniref:hypothetical protein n=1 Tax=Streptosporangium sp. CA-235898 TaxID=3240073 RepID=UPI003F493F64
MARIITTDEQHADMATAALLEAMPRHVVDAVIATMTPAERTAVLDAVERHRNRR